MGTRKGRRARGGGAQEARLPLSQQPGGGDSSVHERSQPAQRCPLHTGPGNLPPRFPPGVLSSSPPSRLSDLDGKAVPLLLEVLTPLRPCGANSHIGCCDPPWRPTGQLRRTWPRALTCSPQAFTIRPSLTGCLSTCLFLTTGSFQKGQVTPVYLAACLVLGKPCAEWRGQPSSMQLRFNAIYALGSVLSPLHGLANKPQNDMRWV